MEELEMIKRTQITLKWCSCFSYSIFVVLFLFNTHKVHSQTATIPEDPYVGQNVFLEKGCNKCHAMWDKPNKSGPNLKNQKNSRTFLGIAAVMWNHLPKMFESSEELNLTFTNFQQKEVNQLIAYLCFLRYSNQKGNFFIGNKLLNKKGCLKCHSIDGSEKKAGPDFNNIKFYISPIYLAQAMWNHGQYIPKAGHQNSVKHIKLDADDFIDITAALQELNSTSLNKTQYSNFGNIENGKRMFAKKGCGNCHESDAKNQSVALDLKNVKIRKGIMEIAASMWNHGPDMWQKIEEQKKTPLIFQGAEMSDLIAYIFYCQYNHISGDREKGEIVFEKKTCNNCHSINGSKKNETTFTRIPNITDPIEMVPRMWNHGPAINESIKKQKGNWPKLNEEEMMDVYAFLNEVNN
jgi:cytochrome c2